ncbi:MAG: hypothetical protein M3N93_15155 [Acidobacteriota bacterium]|nr:hypothetical protein [Acidobacteriota bacterium]
MANGKPDLSGLWEMDPKLRLPAAVGEGDAVSPEFIDIGLVVPGGLPYQPWAAALVKKRTAELRVNDPTSYGLPLGVVRMLAFPTPRKIIQVPGQLVILSEYNSNYRQIFTDGRPLLTDPNPSFNGYSTGKWEGDVLVVQSNGFRDGIWLDGMGNPLTEAAKITERYHRLNFGHLDIAITVDDPKAYTKPWTITLKQTIRLDTDLLDYFVNENEKDLQHFAPK